jgi:transcriptional regulator with XRE-family HTH domain
MTGRGGMADESSRFGARLRDTRRRAGLTQEALAARAGISVAALRDLEQGRTVFPHPTSAHRIARALGLTEAHLHSWRKATGEPGGTARLSPEPAAPKSRPETVTVSVLGTLEVRQGARRVPINAHRQRLLLARLALSPGAFVDRAEVFQLVWGADPPATAATVVQAYVARLRRLLRSGRSARGTGLSLVLGGYRLRPGPDTLDLDLFRRLVAEARTARPETAAARLDQALGLWRGEPLADLPQLAEHPLARSLRTERRVAEELRATLPGPCAPQWTEPEPPQWTLADPVTLRRGYSTVSARAAETFRALALYTVDGTVDVARIATAAEHARWDLEDDLDELADAHLIRGEAPGRYGIPPESQCFAQTLYTRSESA